MPSYYYTHTHTHRTLWDLLDRDVMTIELLTDDHKSTNRIPRDYTRSLYIYTLLSPKLWSRKMADI